jgi:hypothetical protein
VSIASWFVRGILTESEALDAMAEGQRRVGLPIANERADLDRAIFVARRGTARWLLG